MDFTLDEQQQLLQDSVRRYLAKTYDFAARQKLVHEGEGFDAAHWRAFVDMGWLGASLPERVGGYGGGAVEMSIILEEFGRALVVEPFLAVGVLAAQTLLAAGGKRADELVAQIVSGDSKVVLAHNERAARGAIEHVETKAAPNAKNGFRLTGRKSLILGGPFAERIIVSARMAGTLREKNGIGLFLIDPAAPGVLREDARLADGMRTSELVLDGVEVPADGVLGDPGRGYAALDQGFAHALVGFCAEAIGAMDRALWITRDYLQTRKQFGVAIGTFQALQHRMADMLIETEMARASLYRALALLPAAEIERARAVSATKAQVGKAAKFVGAQAIQLHGGIGVTEEYTIGHYFKRLTFFENAFGSTQAHLSRLAALTST